MAKQLLVTLTPTKDDLFSSCNESVDFLPFDLRVGLCAIAIGSMVWFIRIRRQKEKMFLQFETDMILTRIQDQNVISFYLSVKMGTPNKSFLNVTRPVSFLFVSRIPIPCNIQHSVLATHPGKADM